MAAQFVNKLNARKDDREIVIRENGCYDLSLVALSHITCSPTLSSLSHFCFCLFSCEMVAEQSGSSGLLVSVIKKLDSSETEEARQIEKMKIDKEFKKTDERLDKLVAKHDGDLTQVVQLFGQISSMITTSRDKIHTVKENLMACKQLLRCRREEIQKLYKDTMQQKYVLEMLEQM